MDEKLTHLELERYHRQMLLEGWGQEGQAKLKDACVFVAGAGGLGSPVLLYLAAAGVGHLRICDFGILELSNLNRQILHDHTRLDKAKALSAKETLKDLNPYIKIEVFHDKIEESSVAKLVADASVIVDCLDNFTARYILNEFAVKNKLAFVHGSIWGWEGRVTTIKFPETACFSCVFPESPPQGVFPVVGVTPGVIGCLEAAEVIKYLVGIGSPLYNELLTFNAKDMSFEKLKLKPDPNCPVCAKYRRQIR